MNTIDWGTIITGTVGALILTAFRFVWSWIKKHDKRTTHLEIQVSSIHNGLLSVNHGFGDAYKKGYDDKYEELVSANNFIENAK